MLTTERILTVVFASLYRLKTLDMKLFVARECATLSFPGPTS